jgi:hypothetical protein
VEALGLGFRIGFDGGDDGGRGIVAWGDCEGQGLAGELDDAWAVELVVFVELP